MPALRIVLLGLLVSLSAFAAPEGFDARMHALEQQHGGRLGVAAWNTADGARLGRREGERFALCSTFKVLLAAAVLHRVDAGRESLDREIAYGPDALLEYAPVTSKHRAMTVGALCAAAVELSDNTAANLLLEIVGGPAGLTKFLRASGDGTTRLDRTEPALNTNLPGDERDTTTPAAMAATLQRLLLGDVLSPRSRKRLAGWMRACKTGDDKLRAGLPRGWKAGDKTGSGANGASNDVAIVWPVRGGGPILAAVYYTGSAADAAERAAVIADVGRAVAAEFGKR